MKLLVGLCGCLLGSVACLKAEAEPGIPLGIEGVTGIRSDFVHRGFQLAESSLDFQIESEILLSDKTSLHLGLSHLTENGGGFFETSGYFEVSHEFGKRLTAGASMTYRDRNESRLDGGFDFGLFTTFELDQNWRWQNHLNFDLGVGGIYAATELEWSTIITDDSFLTIKSGLSTVSSYLDRDGLNDHYTRLSFTYALSESVSFTPFIGTSLQLSDTSNDDLLFGGLWFEVIF